MIFLLSCLNTEPYEKRWIEIRDFDQDGISIEEGDCDDDNPVIFPDAAEVCDQLDNNCNGSIDEDAIDSKYWGIDLDLDGYAQQVDTVSCSRPSHQLIDVFGDCDDTNAAIYPLAAETWQNAFVDNDCDEELEGVSYNVDSDSLSIQSFASAVRPIVLNDFEILKLAYPALEGGWYFYRPGETLWRETEARDEGYLGVGFQNHAVLEFRDGAEHWLGFYTELDILSPEALSVLAIQLTIPSEELQFLRASDGGEQLAIGIEMDEETIIYVIDEVPTESKNVVEMTTPLVLPIHIRQMSWVSGEIPQIIVNMDDEYHFYQREEGEWIRSLVFREDCKQLLHVQEQDFICLSGKKAILYRIDNGITVQDSSRYEREIQDVFILDIAGTREPFILLTSADSAGYISYSFTNEQIGVSSQVAREIEVLSPLTFEGKPYLALWDQLHSELLMVLIPVSG